MRIAVDGLLSLAQEQPPPGAGCQQMALFLLIIFAIFYFIMIRPQRKEQEKQRQFLERLKKGDRVVTTSGILGHIVDLDAQLVTLDVGDRTKIKLLRNQVARYFDESAEPTPERRGRAASKADDQDGADDSAGDGADKSGGRPRRRRKGR